VLSRKEEDRILSHGRHGYQAMVFDSLAIAGTFAGW